MQTEKEYLDDLMQEIELFDDEEIKYKIGDCFVSFPLDGKGEINLRGNSESWEGKWGAQRWARRIRFKDGGEIESDLGNLEGHEPIESGVIWKIWK